MHHGHPGRRSCDIDVAFAPTASGAASASLTATATPGGTTSAALAGTGQSPAVLSISETSYDFGFTDSPVEHVITVTNDGDATTGTPTLTLTGSGAFDVTTNACTAALPGHESCTVGVTYTGSGQAVQSAQLAVSATPGGTVTSDLTGSPQALTVAPTSRDFGVPRRRHQRADVVHPHQPPPIPVQVDGEGLTGPFTLDTSCFPVIIPAGGTCTFSANFAPTSPGPTVGYLDYFAQGASARVELLGEASVRRRSRSVPRPWTSEATRRVTSAPSR